MQEPLSAAALQLEASTFTECLGCLQIALCLGVPRIYRQRPFEQRNGLGEALLLGHGDTECVPGLGPIGYQLSSRPQRRNLHG